MRLRFLLIVSVLLSIALPVSAQASLHQRLANIANDAHGKVYVSCSLPGIKLDCDLASHGHPPMQSTFKLPLAIAVLQQVQVGKLNLDQPIPFLPSDRYATYSPLQDSHPNTHAAINIPLHDLLKVTVSQSDNIGANILLRIIGGPEAVQHSLDALGLSTIHVRDDEHALHNNEQLQYRNDAEPAAMVALLRRLADDSPLSPDLTAFLLDIMTKTVTGPHRIRGLLPPGILVAHKTGSSDTVQGMTSATNDIGLITLPNGHTLAVAIFVIDSSADEGTRESVIARIAKAVYDEAISKSYQDGPAK
jgi:beta-lactamase class A